MDDSSKAQQARFEAVFIVDPIVKTVFAQNKRQYRMNYPIKFYPISKCRF